MAREKMFDPQFQKAFTEAIHTENRIRMKFHLENLGGKRENAIESDESSSEDEIEKPTIAPAPKRIRFKLNPKPDQKKDIKRSKEDVLKKLSCPASKPKTSVTRMAQPPSEMRPVDKTTRLLLYQGISHEEEGRYQYLRKRMQQPPEVRYRFPFCSSWEYGWNYGLKRDEPAQSEYGRRQIIKQSFYRPNDPQLKPKD